MMTFSLPEPDYNMTCIYKLDKNLSWLSVSKIRYDLCELSIVELAIVAEKEAQILFPECTSIYVVEAMEQTINRCSACENPCLDKNKPEFIHRNVRIKPLNS